jgi:hypothetical protein
MDVLAATDTLPQRCFQIDRPTVFPQQIAKRLSGQRLKIDSLVARQKGNGLPGLLIKLNSLTRHLVAPSRGSLDEHQTEYHMPLE